MCDFFFLVIFASAVGYSLFSSARIFLFWRLIHAGQNWPQAAGRVVGSDIVSYRTTRGPRAYYAEIIYSYIVLGTEYTGKSKLDTESNYEQDAEKDAAQYPAGMPITVCYNPKQPQECITDYDHINRLDMILWAAFLITVVTGVAALLFSDV